MVNAGKKELPHEALNVEFIKPFSFSKSQFLFPIKIISALLNKIALHLKMSKQTLKKNVFSRAKLKYSYLISTRRSSALFKI